MTLDIPREPLDNEPSWLDELGGPGADLRTAGREVLARAFEEAGIEQGAYDQRIAEWLGGFEISAAIAAASWIVRAYDAGLASAAESRTSYGAIGAHVYAPMPDQPRTSPEAG